MRIIDQWSGGATSYNQVSYRLSETSTGDYVLEWKQKSDDDDSHYSPVTSSSRLHRIARKIAELLLEEDRMRNVVDIKRNATNGG